MITRRAALAATGLLFYAGLARAAVTPPSIAELARQGDLSGAALSPNGQLIAMIGEQGEGKARRPYLDLIDASKPEGPRRRTMLDKVEVQGVAWANDDRLLIWLMRDYTVEGQVTGTRTASAPDKLRVRWLMSLNAAGGDPVMMFGRQRDLIQYNWDLGHVIDMLEEEPDHLLMRVWEPKPGVFALHKVDVRTGASVLVERGSPNTRDWSIQGGSPVLRWDATRRTMTTVFAREEAGGWKAVHRIARNSLLRPDFDILAATEEPGVFLVASRGDSDPTAAIRRFNFKTMSFGEVVASRPDRDVDGALLDRHGRYAGARYVEDRVAYDFVDKKLAPHIRGIEGFFGRECNVRIIDLNATRTRLLFFVSGPRMPGAYYYYDLDAKNLQNLGVNRPWLQEDRLARVEALDVTTRDAVKLRAYLTVPLAPGPRPLVVAPHGGPEARDSYDFDLLAQTLAAQGWMVLQPNFRGSYGYGRAFADAGRRRWGDRMQEDVEDAVDQLVASGRVDKARIAICGMSYGGYAALMGAVRRPSMYRCSVAMAGVSDLQQMLEDERKEGADGPSYRYWLETVGDPATEAARLAASSPRLRAAEVAAPVLLMHGLDDEVVLPTQSRLMAAALRDAGKSVEHVELPGADHGLLGEATRTKVLEKVTAFIGRSFA